MDNYDIKFIFVKMSVSHKARKSTNKISKHVSKKTSNKPAVFDAEKCDMIIDEASKTLNNVLFGKISKKEQQRLDSCLENDSGIRDPFHFPAVVQEKLGSVEDADCKTPKRPRSAYNFFTSESKKKGKKISEVGKEWKELEPSAKRKYEDLVNQDKARYREDVKKYEEENGPLQKKLPRNDINRKCAMREAFEEIAHEIIVLQSRSPQLTQKDVLHFQMHLHVATKMFLSDCRNLQFSMPLYDETPQRGLAFIDTWISQAKEMMDVHKENPELCVRIGLVIMSVNKLHELQSHRIRSQ